MAVSDALTKNFVELEVRLPLEDGKTLAWLASLAEIMSKQYNDDHALVHCRMPTSAAGKLAGHGADIRVISGKIPVAAEKNIPNDATFLPPLPNDAPLHAASDSLTSGTASGTIGEVA
jgi:GTP-binding protein HflX